MELLGKQMNSKMKSYLKGILPANVQLKIKESSWWTKIAAKRLARSSKRLDLCAAQIAHSFHCSEGPRLKGKGCVEIGSGWVLSHSLISWLLGA
jgi:hypothetical protein